VDLFKGKSAGLKKVNEFAVGFAAVNEALFISAFFAD